jgi:hypothetical protein
VSQVAVGRVGCVIVGRQIIFPRTIIKTTVVRHGKHLTKHVTRHVIPSWTVAAARSSAGLTRWIRGPMRALMIWTDPAPGR